jgi:type VI secretion system protein ImpH
VRSPISAWARLLREPRRFRFDAALRLVALRRRQPDPAEAARFRAAGHAAYPAAEIDEADAADTARPPRLSVGVIGLTGAAGTLPRLYTETLTSTLRNRSRAMADFLDLLAHRLVAAFAGAGFKYRLHRAAEQAAIESRADPVSDALLALTGYGTPNLAPRLAAGTSPLLHYSGIFAARPRSADRLGAMLSDWLGRPVEVEQFAGAWLALPPDQRSAMPVGRRPGQYNALGINAAIGVRAWDPQARIVLRIGPLDRASFESLLPDQPLLRRLVSLVRAYVGFEIGFAINPVLAGPEVPPLHLAGDAAPPARLGWNSWIPTPGPPRYGLIRPDAAEAVFEAEVVEAVEAAARGT